MDDLTAGVVSPLMNITENEMTTDRAGVLSLGDEFEYQFTEGGNWQAFTFLGHTTHPKGGEWVTVYGGDPVRSASAHRRQWHSLPVDRVVSNSRPIRKNWRSKRA